MSSSPFVGRRLRLLAGLPWTTAIANHTSPRPGWGAGWQGAGQGIRDGSGVGERSPFAECEALGRGWQGLDHCSAAEPAAFARFNANDDGVGSGWAA
jgi:hypothetical protein